jgi:outer membrane protein assembly factor BamB
MIRLWSMVLVLTFFIFEVSVFSAESDQNAEPTPNYSLRLLWRREVRWPFPKAPAIGDGFLFVMTDKGRLSAINLNTGKDLNSMSPEQIGDYESPVVDGNLLFLSCGNSNIEAIDVQSWKVLWSTYTVPKDEKAAEGFHKEFKLTAPVVSENELYLGSQEGNMYILDKATGKVLSKEKIGAQVHFISSLEGTFIYAISSEDGNYFLCTVDMGTRNLLSKIPLDEEIDSTPQKKGNFVYVSGRKGSVFAMDATTNKIVWKKSLGQEFNSDVAASNKLLCAADRTGIYGLDPLTGEMLWKVDEGAENPKVLNGRLFFITKKGYFCALNGKDGEVTDRHPIGGTGYWSKPVFSKNRVLISGQESPRQGFICCFELEFN